MRRDNKARKATLALTAGLKEPQGTVVEGSYQPIQPSRSESPLSADSVRAN
jgi:hypothetical protein